MLKPSHIPLYFGETKVLMNFIRRLKRGARLELARLCDRQYSSWSDAALASGFYEDGTLTRFRVARLEANPNHSIQPELLASSSLPLLASLAGRPLHVVDFGGAVGEYGVALKRHFPKTRYTVVENNSLVEAIGNRVPEIEFSVKIPTACDVFFTSGAIQYLEDPYSVLEKGFSSAKFAVVIRRNSFAAREVFRVQREKLFANGPGVVPGGFSNISVSFPHRTIVESKVCEIATRHGFSLAQRTHEPDETLAQIGGAYGAHLLFLKQ